MKRILLLLTGLLLTISSLQVQNPGDLDLTFNSNGINSRVLQIKRHKQFKVSEQKFSSNDQIMLKVNFSLFSTTGKQPYFIENK
jgi:hypothetical protein